VRVLFLHSRYLSGPASGENRFVEEDTRLLREAGHDVHVHAPSPTGVSGLGLVRTAFGAVWSPAAVHEVRRQIRRQHVDVVHVLNLFPTLSPSVVSAAAAEGVPVVMTLPNYRLLCLPASLRRDGRYCQECLGKLPWRGVLHRCYRGSALASGALATSLTLHRALGTFDSVSLYLAVSAFVRDKYIEAGFPSDRLRVSTFVVWPCKRREGPGDYFLYLGRLSAEKGVGELLDAWRGMRARLVVVGDGPQAKELRRSAPSGVEFRGLVEPSEVPSLLGRARALLVPSIWPEPSGRVVIEACAAGVPVVARAVGGLPEFVENETTGLLVRGGVAAWVEAVERLLDDALSERMGEAAWGVWERRFTPERGLEGLLAAYQAAGARVDVAEPPAG
jgi:glycosyltransferase involved in cell wall biosynthesis